MDRPRPRGRASPPRSPTGTRGSSPGDSSRRRRRTRGAARWRRRRTPRTCGRRAPGAGRSSRRPPESGTDLDGLSLERREESGRVGAPEHRVEVPGARREIVGRRDRDRRRDRTGRALLAEPLEQYVASERHPDREERGRGLARGERAGEEVEVLGLAGVVEPRPAVRQHPLEVDGVAGARAKVHRRAAPAAPADLEQKALHVDRVGAALETVEHDALGRPAGPSRWSTIRSSPSGVSRISRRSATCRRERARRPQTVWRCGPGSQAAGRNAGGPYEGPFSADKNLPRFPT